MLCRFEDRQLGSALVMEGEPTRITVSGPGGLAQALADIDAASAAGKWIALALDYELGEWLEPRSAPEAATNGAARQPSPRLRAWVFDHARRETPWAPDESRAAGITDILPRLARADYLKRIATIRAAIAAGEVYQINYTMPLDIQFEGRSDTLYRHLANRHPSAHAAYIEDGDYQIMSFSPERFIAREADLLSCRPMKGTAPRHADPATDQALGEALRRSVKDRAENVMIVDLLRNDLGRVAQPGSVVVDPLFELERYPSVWTLTSTVQARAPHLSLAALLRALFPCGSITGAPKIAAMQKIRQLEPWPRGLYCGSIGWMAPGGDLSLNVAIRTLISTQAGKAAYHVGGGIVHDSDAAWEWEECLWKARLLLDACRHDTLLSRWSAFPSSTPGPNHDATH